MVLLRTLFTDLTIEVSTFFRAGPAYFGANYGNFPRIFSFSGTKAGAGSSDIYAVQTQLMALFHIRLPQMLVQVYSASGYGLIACINTCLHGVNTFIYALLMFVVKSLYRNGSKVNRLL
jgi:hypothetical protein